MMSGIAPHPGGHHPTAGDAEHDDQRPGPFRTDRARSPASHRRDTRPPQFVLRVGPCLRQFRPQRRRSPQPTAPHPPVPTRLDPSPAVPSAFRRTLSPNHPGNKGLDTAAAGWWPDVEGARDQVSVVHPHRWRELQRRVSPLSALFPGEHGRCFPFEVDVRLAADVDGNSGDGAAGESPGLLPRVVVGDGFATVPADA
jgi:hypothetical protein